MAGVAGVAGVAGGGFGGTGQIAYHCLGIAAALGPARSLPRPGMHPPTDTGTRTHAGPSQPTANAQRPTATRRRLPRLLSLLLLQVLPQIRRMWLVTSHEVSPGPKAWLLRSWPACWSWS